MSKFTVFALSFMFSLSAWAFPLTAAPIRFPLHRGPMLPLSGQQQLMIFTKMIQENCQQKGVSYKLENLVDSIGTLNSDDLAITCLWPALVNDLNNVGSELSAITGENDHLSWSMAARFYDWAMNDKDGPARNSLTLYTRLLNTHRYLRQALSIVIKTANPWYGPSSKLILGTTPALSAWMSELTPWSMEFSYLSSLKCETERRQRKCFEEREISIASLSLALETLEQNETTKNLLAVKKFSDAHKRSIETQLVRINQTLLILDGLWGRPQSFMAVKPVVFNERPLRPNLHDYLDHLTIGHSDDLFPWTAYFEHLDMAPEMIVDTGILIRDSANHPFHNQMAEILKYATIPVPRIRPSQPFPTDELLNDSFAGLANLLKNGLGEIEGPLVNPREDQKTDFFRNPARNFDPKALIGFPSLGGSLSLQSSFSSRRPTRTEEELAYLNGPISAPDLIAYLENLGIRERFAAFQTRALFNSTTASAKTLSPSQKELLTGYLLLMDIQKTIARFKSQLPQSTGTKFNSKTEKKIRARAEELFTFFKTQVFNRLTK